MTMTLTTLKATLRRLAQPDRAPRVAVLASQCAERRAARGRRRRVPGGSSGGPRGRTGARPEPRRRTRRARWPLRADLVLFSRGADGRAARDVRWVPFEDERRGASTHAAAVAAGDLSAGRAGLRGRSAGHSARRNAMGATFAAGACGGWLAGERARRSARGGWLKDAAQGRGQTPLPLTPFSVKRKGKAHPAVKVPLSSSAGEGDSGGEAAWLSACVRRCPLHARLSARVRARL